MWTRTQRSIFHCESHCEEAAFSAWVEWARVCERLTDTGGLCVSACMICPNTLLYMCSFFKSFPGIVKFWMHVWRCVFLSQGVERPIQPQPRPAGVDSQQWQPPHPLQYGVHLLGTVRTLGGWRGAQRGGRQPPGWQVGVRKSAALHSTSKHEGTFFSFAEIFWNVSGTFSSYF